MKKCTCNSGLPSWRARKVHPIRLINKAGEFELYDENSKIEVNPEKLGKFPCGQKDRKCPACKKKKVVIANRITHHRITLAG